MRVAVAEETWTWEKFWKWRLESHRWCLYPKENKSAVGPAQQTQRDRAMKPSQPHSRPSSCGNSHGGSWDLVEVLLKNVLKCYLSKQQMEEQQFDIRSLAMCPAHNWKHRCLSAMAKKFESEKLEESSQVSKPLHNTIEWTSRAASKGGVNI